MPHFSGTPLGTEDSESRQGPLLQKHPIQIRPSIHADRTGRVIFLLTSVAIGEGKRNQIAETSPQGHQSNPRIIIPSHGMIINAKQVDREGCPSPLPNPPLSLSLSYGSVAPTSHSFQKRGILSSKDSRVRDWGGCRLHYANRLSDNTVNVKSSNINFYAGMFVLLNSNNLYVKDRSILQHWIHNIQVKLLLGHLCGFTRALNICMQLI